MSDQGTGKAGQQSGKPTSYRRPVFNSNSNSNAMPTVKKFNGRCEELEGHIIDCGQPKHADAHSTTIVEIINHIRVNFKQGELVSRTTTTGKLIALKKPVKEKDANETDLAIY